MAELRLEDLQFTLIVDRGFRRVRAIRFPLIPDLLDGVVNNEVKLRLGERQLGRLMFELIIRYFTLGRYKELPLDNGR